MSDLQKHRRRSALFWLTLPEPCLKQSLWRTECAVRSRKLAATPGWKLIFLYPRGGNKLQAQLRIQEMKTERHGPSEPPLSLMGLGFWLLLRWTVPAVPSLISNETEGGSWLLHKYMRRAWCYQRLCMYATHDVKQGEREWCSKKQEFKRNRSAVPFSVAFPTLINIKANV